MKFPTQVDGLGSHVPGNWGYCSCSRPTIGSVPRGSDCFAASSSLSGEVINLSPDSDDLNINARGGDAVIFPTSRPSSTISSSPPPRSSTELPPAAASEPASSPIIVQEEDGEVERSVLEPVATADVDSLAGGRFDKCLGFEVLPFPFNDSGTFLPNENECIPFVSEI